MPPSLAHPYGMQFSFFMIRPPPGSTLFPYTTLFRSGFSHMPVRVLTPAQLFDSLAAAVGRDVTRDRSEEHTSELQSHSDLVCRLLLEKKKVFQRAHGGVSTRLLVTGAAGFIGSHVRD